MKFSEVIEQAKVLLGRKGRISYRALKMEFDLTDEQLDILTEELIDIEELAIDKDGRMLVWVGKSSPASRVPSLESKPLPSPDAGRQTPDARPISYTPQHLAERIRAEQAAMEARGSADGERKTITALFADLKGSTALIEGLDPEDARAIIDPTLQLMMDAVHRYDGYVAQALGDGIFALFGAPIAHEDHPQRALYAALRMQEEMRGYADALREQGHPPLLMRVGVNTGEVVMRSIRKDDLHADYMPVGHSTNLAARMEQLAAPGSIVVTANTQKITYGYFEFKDLGKTRIKGVKDPLNVYEVHGAGTLRTRFQVTARRGLTRFVGRHSELDHIQRALAHAKEGHGQIVGVMGEPGLGKSRLFYEFKLLSQSNCLVLEAYAVSYGKASPYLPLIELLRSYFEITPEDDERKRQEKVTGKVLTLDRSLEETLPYLLALLGIEDREARLHQMDAQVRRQRTFDSLKRLFLRESLNQPLLLIFEDLHWIDSETQGFLETLGEGLASAQVLLLVSYRPEYSHEWGQKTYYAQLRLGPLGKEEAEELFTSLLGRDASLEMVKPLLLEKTEGTPFFMEEVIQTLVEEGALVGTRGQYHLAHAPTELNISPTVQGVLAARIDRLEGEEKALLQQLAVIGRSFPVSLVKQVVPQSEADLYRVLAALQTKEFLYEQPAFPEVEYQFKHALTQEVAYGTVLQKQQKILHERTAEAIESLYHENLDDHYTALAHHYSQSGNTQKAVDYLQLAGQQAIERSANQDAVALLTQARALLQTLPPNHARARQELTLSVSLGVPFSALNGYAAPEVGAVYQRAMALCQDVGEAPELGPTLLGLWVFNLLRADLQTARDIAERLLRFAEQRHDSGLFVEGHMALGETVLLLGDFIAARPQLEKGVALYDVSAHRALSYQFSINGGIVNSLWLAVGLWVLGYPDQALACVKEGLANAREVAQPQSVGYALNFMAYIHQFRGESREAQTYADQAISLSHAQGLPFWLALGTFRRGEALARQGEVIAGLALLRQGIAGWRATGAEVWIPYYLTVLAEVSGGSEPVQDGLSFIAEAQALSRRTEERYWEAEFHRVKGALLLQASPDHSGEAEASFHQALAVARQQEAKSFELRAATSLARLWQSQGKQAEARALLAPVYGWFTEGFDTADLKDAKALLDAVT